MAGFLAGEIRRLTESLLLGEPYHLRPAAWFRGDYRATVSTLPFLVLLAAMVGRADPQFVLAIIFAMEAVRLLASPAGSVLLGLPVYAAVLLFPVQYPDVISEGLSVSIVMIPAVLVVCASIGRRKPVFAGGRMGLAGPSLLTMEIVRVVTVNI